MFYRKSPFLIIDHIHAKINRVCCAALAIGEKCMNVRKNKLFIHIICPLYTFPWLWSTVIAQLGERRTLECNAVGLILTWGAVLCP